MNLLSQIDSFKNNQKIITYDQSTNDIINAILRQHNKSLNDYDKLYCYFDGGNCIDTAKKVFKYLKENVKYVIEPENLQTVKTPSAILATGKTTGSDCKNFSLFFAGILDAYRRNTGEKFDIAYRFASYDGTNTPEHVFVVINPDTENELWCDAVLNYFNEKKQPNYFKDKKIKNMALMALSGISQQAQMNGVFDFLNPKGPAGPTGPAGPGGPGGKGGPSGSSGTGTTQQGSGFVNVLTSVTGAIPVFGSTISSLIGLVSGLFAGHSENYLFDTSFAKGEYDKALGIAFKWYQQFGLTPKSVNPKLFWGVGTKDGINNTVPQPFISIKRMEWLPTIWENTKNTDLTYIINEAIASGYLDKKYFINSKNEMAPEPGAFSNLFGGGSADGKSNRNYTVPFVVGGAALVAFLIFKKKS